MCCCEPERVPWTFQSLPISLGLDRSRDLDLWKEHKKVIEFYTKKKTPKQNQKVQEIPVY